MLDGLTDRLSALSDRRTRFRRNVERVFNREVLGSVVVSGSLMKIIEKSLTQEPELLLSWSAVFVAWVWVCVKWDALAEAADEAVETAAEAAEAAEEATGGE